MTQPLVQRSDPGDLAPVLQRVVDASQRAVSEQIEVLRVDAQLRARRFAVTAALSASAVVLGIAAWALLLVAALVAFETVPWATRLLIAGGGHLAVALVLGAALWARRERE